MRHLLPVGWALVFLFSHGVSYTVRRFRSRFTQSGSADYELQPFGSRTCRFDNRLNARRKKAYLETRPDPNSLGNFIENSTDSGVSFIQCHMLAVGNINGVQYGVGFPMDMPVMLSYFEGKELIPVEPDYPDFDHLVHTISVQLDANTFQLFKTPVVLTLQGEFEDEDMNIVDPFTRAEIMRQREEEELEELDDDELEYVDSDEVEEYASLEELLEEEGISMNDEDYDDDYDDDDEEEEDDEYDEDENGGLGISADAMGDFTIVRPENLDASELPPDAMVTEEDTKKLRRAHRKAERILEYASDVKLIASFHYKKRNFHLVRLLDPLFIIGRRIPDIKGFYFTLLDDDESETVRPILEDLLINGPPPPDPKPKKGRKAGAGSNLLAGSDDTEVALEEKFNRKSSTEKSQPMRKSKRRWTQRKKN